MKKFKIDNFAVAIVMFIFLFLFILLLRRNFLIIPSYFLLILLVLVIHNIAKTSDNFFSFVNGIVSNENILDKTSIHPESYQATLELLTNLGLDTSNIGSEELMKKLEDLDLEKYSKEHGVDIYTLEDIVKCLKQPNRDFRDDYQKPLLRSDILKIEDLKRGMELEGTVRNVVDFGVFIDIGLHDDGLAHISKLTKDYIKHPMEVVNVGDIVKCYVDDVNLEKNKVSLSLINPSEI